MAAASALPRENQGDVEDSGPVQTWKARTERKNRSPQATAGVGDRGVCTRGAGGGFSRSKAVSAACARARSRSSTVSSQRSSPALRNSCALPSSQRMWDEEILPALYEYIRIPNKSPAFDPRWQQNMDRAVALIEGWCRKQPVAGLSLEVVRLENRTPVIYMEVPGQGSETVL